MLPNGNIVLEHDVFNVATTNWIPVNALRGQGEACWVKLPDDSILTVDGGATTASRFIPAQNQWVNDATCPVALYGYGFEEGGAHLLPNGKIFFVGGTVNTAIYTPSGSASPGSWVAGPTMIFGTNALGAVDAPSAMLVNGNILIAIGPTNGFQRANLVLRIRLHHQRLHPGERPHRPHLQQRAFRLHFSKSARRQHPLRRRPG